MGRAERLAAKAETKAAGASVAAGSSSARSPAPSIGLLLAPEERQGDARAAVRRGRPRRPGRPAQGRRRRRQGLGRRPVRGAQAQDRGDPRAAAPADGRRAARTRRRRHAASSELSEPVEELRSRAAAALDAAAALGLAVHAARGAVGPPRRPAPRGAGRRGGPRRPHHRAALRLPRRLPAELQPARHAQGRRPGARRAARPRRRSPAISPAGRTAWPSLQRQLRRLVAAAPLGVFGVLGNHDHGDSKAPFVRRPTRA